MVQSISIAYNKENKILTQIKTRPEEEKKAGTTDELVTTYENNLKSKYRLLHNH